MLGHEVNSKWNITVSLESIGENARTKAVGVIPDPLSKTDPTKQDWKDYCFQVQGEVRVAITGAHKDTSPGMKPYIQVSSLTTVIPDFSSGFGAENVATTSFPAEAFYSSESKESSYTHSWYLRIDLWVYDPNLGQTSDEKTVVIELKIAKFRHIWAEQRGLMAGHVGIYDLSYSSTGTDFQVTRSTVNGESVQLSTSPETPASLSPESGVSADYMGWGNVDFTLSCPLNEFVTPQKISVPITVTCEGYPPVVLSVNLYYAEIVGVSSYGVEYQDPISGEWSPLFQGRHVSKDDKIKLSPQADGRGGWLYPWVRAAFADGQMHELALKPYDPEKMGPILITFGDEGMTGQKIAWMIDVQNLDHNLQLNWCDYAREFIWNRIVGGIVDYTMPGSGWIARKASGQAAAYVVRKVREPIEEQQNKQPSPFHSQMIFNQESRNEETKVGRASTSDYTGFDQDVTTADSVVALTGAGVLRAENRFGILELSDLNVNQTAYLGPGTSVQVDETGISASSPLPPLTGDLSNALTITPSDGGSMTSLTPLITLTYDNAYANFKPDSLICRVNGVLVTSYASISLTQATVQVANAARLKSGQNTVTAAIWEASSGWHEASSTFSASGNAGQPTGLSGLSGRTSMILTWDGGGGDIDGYNVYKGSTSDSITAMINANPVQLPAYPITSVDADFWYAVKAVAGSTESALSQPVQANLNPSADQTAPAQVATLNVTPSDKEITISFTPPARAPSVPM